MDVRPANSTVEGIEHEQVETDNRRKIRHGEQVRFISKEETDRKEQEPDVL